MSRTVAAYTLQGLVVRPADYTLAGGELVAPCGTRYVIGPALYRVTPSATPHGSLAVPAGAPVPSLDPVYLPEQQWPPGVVIDNAVVADSSDVAELA